MKRGSWLLDSDVLIEGERGDSRFVRWLASAGQVAILDSTRAEFLFGVHQVSDLRLRRRGESFFREFIVPASRAEMEPGDFLEAARLAGEARRAGRGRPGILDGLMAAVALRIGAGVATRNLKDFEGMGVECHNPLVK